MIAKILKWIGLGLVGIIALSFATFIIAASFTSIPGEEKTPSGLKRNQALYVEMRDGVKIAIDVWLPEEHTENQKIPAMLYMTRYGRASDVGPLQRAMIGLGLAPSDDIQIFPAKAFNGAGYAFIQVDARGSGASFGNRLIETSPDEVKDYGEIVDWITKQPWSDGHVGAIGISYNGTTAELLAVTQHPAVTAVAPLYSDFDPQYGLVQPGGAKSGFLDAWGAHVGRQDNNDTCAIAGQTGFMCWVTKLWSSGVKPVDGSNGDRLLEQAIKDHQKNTPVADGFKSVVYREDLFGESGLKTSDISPFGYRSEIEASNVSYHLWLGWYDAATTDGALSRFNTFTNDQELIIGPFSHGGFNNVDPFVDPATPPSPSTPDQWGEMISFFDSHFKGTTEPKIGKSVRYYTMGADLWRTSDVWPPKGLTPTNYFFDTDNSLNQIAPDNTDASDSYVVDKSASSGNQTRWHTNLGGGDVIYPDRRDENQKLLSFTSAPLSQDMEITGTPILDLYLTSSTDDGVVHAYLEAVDKDGTVIYLTEGILRLIHRKVSDAEPPYAQLGVYHSYLKSDAAPMPIGQPEKVALNLYATSVKIPAGYSIRVSLGGADSSLFAPIPADSTPEWQVHRSSAMPSKITLPMAPLAGK